MKTFKQFITESFKTKHSYDDIPELLEFFEDDIEVRRTTNWYSFGIKDTSSFYKKPKEFEALLQNSIDDTCSLSKYKKFSETYFEIRWNANTAIKSKILYTPEEIHEANQSGDIEKIEDELNDIEVKVIGGNTFRSKQLKQVTFLVTHTRETKKQVYVGVLLEGPEKGRPFTMLVPTENLKKDQEVFVYLGYGYGDALLKFKGLTR